MRCRAEQKYLVGQTILDKGFDRIHSPEFTCFGHQWCLRVYPGGANDSSDGKVAIYLRHMSNKSIEVQATFIVKESHKTVAVYQDLDFQPRGSDRVISRGVDFAKRSTLVCGLKEGALLIEVQMRQTKPANEPSTTFILENPLFKNVLKSFMDEESSDVVFEVGSDPARNTRNKPATNSTFYAHRYILQESSLTLAELCKSWDNMTSIPITGVKPHIFRFLLYYSYGGKVSAEDLKANTKDIIDAADKYGVVGLKLEAEASLVASATFTVENVIDNLLYADSKNCALLKEAAMDYLVDNGVEVAEKNTFEAVPGYMMKDLLTAVNRGKKEADTKIDSNDFSTMRVNTLRKLLHDKGLDVDGSREAMISLLKQNS